VTWLRANWDRTLGWCLIGVGAALLVLGTVRVADSFYLADQLSYLMSAGLGGLGCLAVGTGLVVAAALHDEWRALDGLERLARETAPLVERNGD
jgi:hypothetical protein